MQIGIAEHGNLRAWNSTSATAPATVAVCSRDMGVLDELIETLDVHEIVFGRLTMLSDALGCAWLLSQISSGSALRRKRKRRKYDRRGRDKYGEHWGPHRRSCSRPQTATKTAYSQL
ncbi:hypothetical protein H4582DRAFT_2014294 [Lactarius indigo]|nr:hypothetical protein H4582DRAFT_2014294 [Lactarius indigo]